jgi:hypothetical protein
MSTINVTKRVTLARYKATKDITKIDIKVSKTKGIKYAVTEDGEYIGTVLPDFDKALPIFILTFTDTESGESWDAVGNYNETNPAVDTL